MKKQYRYIILAYLCFHLFTSCELNNDLKPQLSSDFKVENIDKELFEHINTANNLSSKDELWNGYKFSEFPMYFVFREAKEEVKKVDEARRLLEI